MLKPAPATWRTKCCEGTASLLLPQCKADFYPSNYGSQTYLPPATCLGTSVAQKSPLGIAAPAQLVAALLQFQDHVKSRTVSCGRQPLAPPPPTPAPDAQTLVSTTVCSGILEARKMSCPECSLEAQNSLPGPSVTRTPSIMGRSRGLRDWRDRKTKPEKGPPFPLGFPGALSPWLLFLAVSFGETFSAVSQPFLLQIIIAFNFGRSRASGELIRGLVFAFLARVGG